MTSRAKALLPLLVLAIFALPALGETGAEDVADIPSQDLRAKGNDNMRFLLIGPKPTIKPPSEGFSLLVVLPGGDGSADYQSFVKRILKFALPDSYIIAQPVAVKWSATQKIVWPTKTSTTPGASFTTEDFVTAVVADVSEKLKVNPARVFTLSWSSSGHAAYAVSLQEKTPVTGSLVAMSVFNPKTLPPLEPAKGRPYYILHSPTDEACPVWMARWARNALTEKGAVVNYVEYPGGHGWSSGNPFGDVRAGIDWLENPVPVEEKPAQQADVDSSSLAALPHSDSFEKGEDAPEGWRQWDKIPGVQYLYDKTTAHEGSASLCFKKTAKNYFPIASWGREFAYDGASRALDLSAWIKADKAFKAVIDVQFIDAAGNLTHKWAAYVGAKNAGDPPANHDWKEYSDTVAIPKGTKRLAIAFQIYGPGTVWLDSLTLSYSDKGT